jgi:Methyltransferase FkbM domain
MKALLKRLLPDRELPLPVLRGPFRGAVLQLHPHHSLRKILGVYEHEMNGWLESVLPRIDTILDVGANDGYFTFGCAAAFRRLGMSGDIFAFEPEEEAFKKLELSLPKQMSDQIRISLQKCYVGLETNDGLISLDDFAKQESYGKKPENALIKIDVEGAELDVIAGASSWINPTNYFLIEVHWDKSFLQKLTKTFSDKNLKLRQINQQALPLLGYESRGREQWWLVSDLS